MKFSHSDNLYVEMMIDPQRRTPIPPIVRDSFIVQTVNRPPSTFDFDGEDAMNIPWISDTHPGLTGIHAKEKPSSLPQAGANGQGGERLSQPQSNSHPNIVPVSNPPGPPGSSLQVSRETPRSAIITKRKQMSSSNKVTIPRQRSGTTTRYSHRVPLACETCRIRKTKYSGDTPICRQCLESKINCQYPVSWRERLKGFVSPILPHWAPHIFCAMITDSKLNYYENLLREINQLIDGRMSEQIKHTLDKYAEPGNEPSSDQLSTNSVSAVNEEPEADLKSLPSSIGSLDTINHVDEDLNRSSHARATGYIGKNSEVTWLQQLGREGDHHTRNLPGPAKLQPDHNFTLHSVNYYLNNLDIIPPGPVYLY
ncbi:hypothetical protein ASPVEDRAFT_26374 [Aspergillus versicolor CBS 583.65]|uniref:Zn(2)-C6 fungal-type domain-containing protein n=1 Tax=Aspergillus versicolor CBS 583.65 TaxID=1036611 RepID=A0A1L9PDP6_ASPVE|nr:uncharacterized protein ASPVEDRAFT_26374 [Aspergillus versicolor CBS 583.65]OJI99574.1 hypothetical protein ASPVEDRAFT_26374 [Aspergillus versicolor CBS 583.65]